jgi:hypothetical protein
MTGSRALTFNDATLDPPVTRTQGRAVIRVGACSGGGASATVGQPCNSANFDPDQKPRRGFRQTLVTFATK